MNRLSNSFTKFVSNFADSDVITSGIKLLSGIVDVADDITGGFNKASKAISNFGGRLDGGNSTIGMIGAGIGLTQSLTGHGEIVLRPLL